MTLPGPSTPVDLSVVICVRNGARVIQRQLDALDRQRDHSPFEVIVVDNGSKDGTKRIVQTWIESGRHAARAARLVAGPRRPSIPAARNIGAQQTVGRVIAFCDADDEVDQNWVGIMARAVRGDVLVGGRTYARDAGGNARPDLFGDGVIGTRYLPHAGTNNCAVSRRVFFAVGGFDESLPRYGFEDVDFSWRVQEAGHALMYAPDAVVHFTVSDAGASVRKKFALGRGRVLMASRYPMYDPCAYTVRGTARELLRELRDSVWLSMRGRRLDRASGGRIIALAGRVIGAIQYGDDRAPKRRLLDVTSEVP